MEAVNDGIKETAYYYPEPYWLLRDGRWVKSLLLFFDEVSILLPDYMMGRQRVADPSLAATLEDRGLLRILGPEWFVDEDLGNALTAAVVELITGGAFDDLDLNEPFAELSMTRMGYHVVEDIAHMVHEELERRGLAKPTEDGVSVPMHWRIRQVYLLLLAQLARDAGIRQGFQLSPTTNGYDNVAGLESFFNLKSMPSQGQVVSFDLETVAIDLDDVPLDDVLWFRADYADSYRRYATDLRDFMIEISEAEEGERHAMLIARRRDIEAAAHDLANRIREAFKTRQGLAGFGLGLAGAAWGLHTGDIVSGGLGLGWAAQSVLPERSAGSAYSYLFKARKELW